MECRTGTKGRFDGDGTTMQFYDALRDGQSQSGANFRSRASALNLLELLKDTHLVGLGNPWPGIVHRHEKLLIGDSGADLD